MGFTQISVNGTITVPEHKPDIEAILRIFTTAIIDKTVTTRKKIFFYGHVDICVEYVSCTAHGKQHIHFLHTEIPFNCLKFHWLARERFQSFAKTKIRFCESDLISTRAISMIIILKLCKVRFRHIVNAPDSHCSIPFDVNACKPSSSHCMQIKKPACEQPPKHCCSPVPPDHDCKQPDNCNCIPQNKDHCKPPSYSPDCMPHHNCDSKPHSHDHDCIPHHKKPCEPPAHSPDCMPHHNCDSKPHSHDHDCRPQTKEPIPPDNFYIPTIIQPYKMMTNSHGVAFGFNYEE